MDNPVDKQLRARANFKLVVAPAYPGIERLAVPKNMVVHSLGKSKL